MPKKGWKRKMEIGRCIQLSSMEEEQKRQKTKREMEGEEGGRVARIRKALPFLQSAVRFLAENGRFVKLW